MPPIWLAVLGSLAAVMVASTPVSAQQKPNVVFILADNVGYGDLGTYGDGKPIGRPPARATSSSLSIANTMWGLSLGERVFMEDRPLTQIAARCV